MPTPTLTVPIADLEHLEEPPFVADAGRVRLRGSRCRGCGERFFPVRQVCLACSGRELDETVLGPAGTLYSYATVHVSSARSTPYTIGYVDLDAGVRVLATVSARADELEPDQRVHLIATDDGAWAVAVGPGDEGSR